MSSFLVSEKSIKKIIAAFCLYDRKLAANAKARDRLGNDLSDLNWQAVCVRYKNHDDLDNPLLGDYSTKPPSLSKPAMVKTLDCYLYQCSQGNIPKNKLFQTVCDLRARLVRSIIESLEEYQSAPWE
jgi:hypothetical protein